MNGEIKFNVETVKAMFAVLRFSEYIKRGDGLSPEKTILEFHEYQKREGLKSEVITQCNCREDLSNREIVFNVCVHCQGVVARSLLDHIWR